jgi:hypothetical protein
MSYSYDRTASLDASTMIERIKTDLFQKSYVSALRKGAELVKDQNLAKRAEALHTLYNLQKCCPRPSECSGTRTSKPSKRRSPRCHSEVTPTAHRGILAGDGH